MGKLQSKLTFNFCTNGLTDRLENVTCFNSSNNKIAENSKPNNKNDFLDDLQTVLTSWLTAPWILMLILFRKSSTKRKQTKKQVNSTTVYLIDLAHQDIP